MTQERKNIRVDDEIAQLRPETAANVELTPDRDVLCCHRGREPYRDMHDSVPYSIQPGYFIAPYGAAVHFQRRAVVPGSRNPETNTQTSFITIIGIVQMKGDGSFDVLRAVDDPDQWAPFTDEECEEYGMAVEALDRRSMVDPIDPNVTVVPTRGALNEAAVKKSRVSGAQGAKPKANPRKPRIEGNTEVLANKADAGSGELQAAGENEAIRQIRADSAARAAGAE